MSSPTLSVILPVYNKAPYIRKCIGSVCRQSFTDFELIVVNDGSTDRSGEIIQEMAKAEKRLCYFEYENQGVSAARNRGLEMATGKYILFIDADDWIEPAYFAHILLQTEQHPADLYVWGITKDSAQGGHAVTPILQGLYPQKEFLEFFVEEQYIKRKGLYGYIPNKLLKNEIVRQYNIRFKAGLRLMEDYDFFLSYYAHIREVYCFAETGYYYVAGTQASSGQLVRKVDYPSLIGVHEKCQALLEGHSALSARNRQILREAISGLSVAAFLEMQPVRLTAIREMLYQLLDKHPSPAEALPLFPGRYRALNQLILKRRAAAIYLYLRVWRLYLTIKRKFV